MSNMAETCKDSLSYSHTKLVVFDGPYYSFNHVCKYVRIYKYTVYVYRYLYM
jgi:hypothetical protein